MSRVALDGYNSETLSLAESRDSDVLVEGLRALPYSWEALNPDKVVQFT